MLIEIDFNSEEALYVQLQNQIIMGIAMNLIQEGDSLPSVRQLANMVGINMHTVNKAYAILKQEGFIQLDRRRGAVIAIDMDKARALLEMKEHLQQYGTVMESWFPLGGRGNTQTLFNDETISGIAADHGKTSAQVILRWHLQAGNIAIPGSSNEAHIQENYEIFDFELKDDEMERMSALNRNERFASY